MNKTPFFSIFIPSYNQGQVISETISSVLNQTFTDYEIIVRDDCSHDDTCYMVSKFQSSKIKLYRNSQNKGYSGNLNYFKDDCHGKYIILLAGDDLLDQNTLQWYFDALNQFPKASAITRPYYWFEKNYKTPIRLKQTVSSSGNLLISTKSKFSDISLLLSTIDQLSGLCFKRDFIKIPFHTEAWISHAYPFLDIFKKHPVIFLKKYPLAVRITTSITRSNIYQNSPMIYWKNMIDRVFSGSSFSKLRNKIIKDFIATNFVGLFQIKNFGSFSSYLREVYYLISFNPYNLINPKFIFIFLFTLFTPRRFCLFLTDKYKTIFYSKIISREIIIHPGPFTYK